MGKKIFISLLILILIGILAYVYVQYAPDVPDKNQEAAELDIDQEMQLLLARKYNKSIEEVRITQVRQKDTFASGSVLFGEGGPGEGGVFLARQVGDRWEIVFDGNGNVDCDSMRNDFGFPDEILVPNFCD